MCTWRFYSIILVALAITQLQHVASQTQPSASISECCDLNLLDASRQVAIETDRILPIGTFSAIRIRLCTMDPVTLQIWTRISATQFQFKWQAQFTATDQQANEVYTMINLQNNPITIGAADRLAFYSPSNASMKIPVPYNTDSINGALFYSQLRFTGSQFVSGQAVNLENLKWPRTFSAYVTFCTSPTDCQTTTTPFTTTRPFTTQNPSGPIGMCCPPPPVGQISCDPGGAIKDNINDQNDQVKVLQDDINRLLYILNNLINSTVVTGICPDGFTAGVYGVGSCYVIHKDERVQLAQAALRCRDNYQAELIRLETDLEDEFIKNTILEKTNPVGIESYWTGGIYNIPLRNWYWYSDNSRTKAPYTYRNWLNGMEPSATSIYDVCSVYTVDSPNSASYWQKKECTDTNYYICEIPKQCL